MPHVRNYFALELGLVLLLSTCCLKVTGYANWKSIECKHLDTIYATLQCHVKPLKRNLAALNIYVNLIHRPLTQLSVKMDFMKRASGWKPFLYNFKVDGCRFLASNVKNPVVNFFYEYLGLRSHSNLNHTCPFDHDIILANHTFPATLEISGNLPLPSGYYGIFTTWFSGGKARVTINAFFTVVDD